MLYTMHIACRMCEHMCVMHKDRQQNLGMPQQNLGMKVNLGFLALYWWYL